MATERASAQEAVERLPEMEDSAAVVLRRIRSRIDLPEGSRALDIGAAQGTHVAALRRLGLDAVGVEPWGEAVEMAAEVGRELGMEVPVTEGTGEHTGFDDSSFDIVFAMSVMEHVVDPATVFAEVHRILRPGGAFYFYTTSALCPRQVEIHRFPLFPWYPTPLKHRIMRWAAESRPSLVNYTEMPAYHWFTPWGTRRLLGAAGFGEVWDRWDLRAADEDSGLRAVGVRAAASAPPLRVVGDVLVPACAYLAIA